MRTNTKKNLDHILSSGYPTNYFEVLWEFSAVPDQAQRICYPYNREIK